MAERDRSAPSRLLQDLESIRNLLDEDPNADVAPPSSTAYAPLTPSAAAQVNDAQLDIPLLQDIVHEQPAAAPGSKPHNPFLPYDSLARLAAERQQLDRLLAPQLDNPGGSIDAEQRQLSTRLHTEAQLILQELLAEMLPSLEQELQRRLNKRLEQVIQQHLQQDR